MVLYRKYRPQKFYDLVGQEHIIKSLTNALGAKKIGHAYLFSGPRGSGKTTLARVLAKSINCTGRKLGKDSFEPCNKCSSCKEISAGKAIDLIEIDAASNRGIDEIRELRDKIKFAPTVSEYKIYIIDEVHMLTSQAFNALLKTLEEPPKHAIFLFATTEPQKVLPTILSRVQRFDFHKANLEELTKLIGKISKSEEIKIDEDAVKLLAQLSYGSYRDSLSLLEQVSSVRQTSASKITLEQVQEILGLAHDKSIFDFIKILAQKNRKKAFDFLGKLYYQGVDLENFTSKCIEILRKIALFKIGQDSLFDLTKDEQSQAKEMSEIFDLDELMTLISKLTGTVPKIKSANIQVLPLEMVVFEITEETEVTEKEKFTPGGPEIEKKEVQIDIKNQNDTRSKPVSIGTKKMADTLWMQIVQEARTHNHSLAALLKDAAIAGEDAGTITLAFKFKFHADMISGKSNTKMIEEIITKITGDYYKIICVVDPELVIKKPLDSDDELLNGAKEVFEVEE